MPLCRGRRRAHDLVVSGVELDKLYPFRADAVEGGSAHTGRGVDARPDVEKSRKARHCATVVAVRRGHERQRRIADRGSQGGEGSPLDQNAEPGGQTPRDRPGRAEDLEGGKPQPLGLVFEEDSAGAQLGGELSGYLGKLDEGRHPVAVDRAVERAGGGDGLRRGPLAGARMAERGEQGVGHEPIQADRGPAGSLG